MPDYDPYDRDRDHRRYVREERREDSRYYEPHRATYTKTQTRELVPRGREDSDLSIEEVHREFPPPGARSVGSDYYEDGYRYREHGRHSRRSPDYYEEERKHSHKPHKPKDNTTEKIIAAVAGAALLAGGKELYDRHEAKQEGTEVQRNPLSSVALAGVGALAAYQGAQFYSKQQARKDQKANAILHRGRDGYAIDYSDDEDAGPKEKKGHKNFLESALAATGLGAAVKQLTGGGDDHRSDTRSLRGSDSRSQSRGGGNKIQKAAMASLLAGATEAFRVSKEPGGWKGEKAKRVLTAAAGAATVDAATDPRHGKLGLAESVIGGLVGNRLINGSRNDIEEDKATGRSRSRSRARSSSRGGGGSGLAALATAGLGALGAKKVLDRSRSRSRRGRSESYSPSPDRRRQRSRSRSVVDKARNSLAKLGIGGGAGGAADDYYRERQDDYSDNGSRRPRKHRDDDYDDYEDDYRRDDYDRRGPPPREQRSRGGRSDYGTESDLGDSSEDEKRAKKMRGKQLITTGLAAVATIHAAHEVYQSVEKTNARHKAVSEGRLSEAEAKKLKKKAILQDAASVGIAALGIKGAFSELKEAKEMAHECKEFKREKAERQEKRRQKRLRSQPDGRGRSESWASSRSRSRGGYDSDDDSEDEPYHGRSRQSGGSLPAPPVGGRWQ